MLQFLQCLNVANHDDGWVVFKKTNSVPFSAKAIPFHALQPGIWVKLMEPASITTHDAFSSILTFVCLLVFLYANREPNGNKLSNITNMLSINSHVASCPILNCYLPILFDEFINFLLKAFCYSCSKLNTMWLTGNSPCSFFKVFLPPPDMVGVCMLLCTNSTVRYRCLQLSCSSWEIESLHVDDGHFIIMDCQNTNETQIMNLWLYLRGQVLLPVLNPVLLLSSAQLMYSKYSVFQVLYRSGILYSPRIYCEVVCDNDLLNLCLFI
jgi:hypothetical protein